MSFQLIPFNSKSSLPAVTGNGNLGDLLVHAATSYPVISIKGKKFAKVLNGERELLMNPKDPDSPATSLGVVILAASRIRPRLFYAKAYDSEEAEGRKPDCMSSDGVKPDAAAAAPQCKTCAACPHNQWGTKRRQDGSMGKGKACDETVRLAIADPSRMNDPMLLRVPPGSMANVGELGKFLHARGIANSYEVLTKITFDMDADAQKLVFTAVGMLPPEVASQAREAAQLEVVQKIVGGDGKAYEPASGEHEEGAAPAPGEEAARPAAKTLADLTVAKAAAKAAARTAPAGKEVTIDEVTAVVAAATEPKKAAKPKATPLEVDNLEIEGLDDVGFDD